MDLRRLKVGECKAAGPIAVRIGFASPKLANDDRILEARNEDHVLATFPTRWTMDACEMGQKAFTDHSVGLFIA
jgi:hypothetical protein